MPHMIIVLIQGLFLKNCYHSFFWPNLASQSEILQIDCTLAYEYIVICDCGFDVYFSKMFVIYIWAQNLATIVLKECCDCCMPDFSFSEIRFLKLGYSNNKTCALYSLKIEIRPWKGYLQYTCHSIRLIMKSYILFQRILVMIIDL